MKVREFAQDPIKSYAASAVIAVVAGFIVHRYVRGLPRAQIRWAVGGTALSTFFACAGIREMVLSGYVELRQTRAAFDGLWAKKQVYGQPDLYPSSDKSPKELLDRSFFYLVAGVGVFLSGFVTLAVTESRVAAGMLALTELSATFFGSEAYLKSHTRRKLAYISDKLNQLKAAHARIAARKVKTISYFKGIDPKFNWHKNPRTKVSAELQQLILQKHTGREGVVRVNNHPVLYTKIITEWTAFVRVSKVAVGGFKEVFRAAVFSIENGRLKQKDDCIWALSRDGVQYAAETMKYGYQIANQLMHPFVAEQWKWLPQGNQLLGIEAYSGVSIDRFFVEGNQLRKEIFIDWIHVVELLRQVACGINHVHEHNVIHKDIKPDNILVTVDPNNGHFLTKLADFDVCVNLQGRNWMREAHENGTQRYLPHECLTKQPYGKSSDIYAFALTAWQLIAPLIGKEDARWQGYLKQRRNLQHRPLPFPTAVWVAPQRPQSLEKDPAVWPEAMPTILGGVVKNSITRGLSHIPSNRPTAGELRETLKPITRHV